MEGGPRARKTSQPQVVPRTNTRRPMPSRSGLLTGLAEQNHLFSRVTRLAQHLPIMFIIIGSFLGIMLLPFTILLFTVCGSIGFGIFSFIVIECAFFLMAVLGSVLLPTLAALPFAIMSYFAYRTSSVLNKLFWKYFGGPIRTYRSVKQRFANAIASFRGQPAVTYPDDFETFDNYNYNDQQEDGTPLENIERQQSSYSTITEEWSDIRHRMSDVGVVHDDSSEDMGFGEGVFLYLADFVHNLITLAFALSVIYLLVTSTSCNR